MNRLQGALLEEAFRLVADGYCTTEDIDIGLKDGLALRWSFMGPFETIDLNAPGRRARLCQRYQQIYERLFPSMQRRVDWAGPVIDRIEPERRAPAAAPSACRDRQRWRDRRLMALLRTSGTRRARSGARLRAELAVDRPLDQCGAATDSHLGEPMSGVLLCLPLPRVRRGSAASAFGISVSVPKAPFPPGAWSSQDLVAADRQRPDAALPVLRSSAARGCGTRVRAGTCCSVKGGSLDQPVDLGSAHPSIWTARKLPGVDHPSAARRSSRGEPDETERQRRHELGRHLARSSSPAPSPAPSTRPRCRRICR